MRYLLLILMITVLSCSKKKEYDHCYHCTFGFGVGGTTRPPLDTCSDAPASTYHFTDANNNDLTSFCEER